MDSDIATWFNGYDRLWSILQGSVFFFFFFFIVAVVLVCGKRTTSQMNNFDWIVLVAIGSLASSGILLKNVSIADAALAIVVIAALQWLTTWLVIRFEWFSRLIKPSPRMLLHKGRLMEGAMRKERISSAEIRKIMRQQGFFNFEDANWVILESDGSMTVIPRDEIALSDAELMQNVRGEPQT